MLEFSDSDERRGMLASLVGIETSVWMQIGDFGRITPVADEGLERSDDNKTSAVHFLRFELTSAEVSALREGAVLAARIDHPNYRVEIRPVDETVRKSLIGNLR